MSSITPCSTTTALLVGNRLCSQQLRASPVRACFHQLIWSSQVGCMLACVAVACQVALFHRLLRRQQPDTCIWQQQEQQQQHAHRAPCIMRLNLCLPLRAATAVNRPAMNLHMQALPGGEAAFRLQDTAAQLAGVIGARQTRFCTS